MARLGKVLVWMLLVRCMIQSTTGWEGKIKNWIRFFGVDPGEWEVSQAGETAWISKRPFHTLSELEKNMPQKPVYEEVRDWYQPVIRQIQEVLIKLCMNTARIPLILTASELEELS